MTFELKALHAAHAATARQRYLAGRSPSDDAEDWRLALREARSVLIKALRATNYLTDIAAAVTECGAHMLALRHFLAPPISQDQFRLLCPIWPKSSERSGTPVASAPAKAVAETIFVWRDRSLTRWLERARPPSFREVEGVLRALSPMIAAQTVATRRRNRLAAQQERAVIALLEAKGWQRRPSSLIDTRAAVPGQTFMHKTRFATASRTPQEVDVACGLAGTVVLAMECKVTNDETNSVKRVNDILKKADAWTKHWGSFVVTAALLDGVIAVKDVNRLIDHGIHVFWSHDLGALSSWLDERGETP